MNTKEILKTHNAWRRGDDDRPIHELGHTALELGDAIDDAVRAISERDQLRVELAQERERAVSARAGGEARPVGWVWYSYNQTNFTSGSHHKEVLEADGVKLTPVYTHPAPVAKVPEGNDTPWPLRSCLEKLCDTADILLDDHSYDGHGHEEIAAARDAARAMLSAAPTPESSAREDALCDIYYVRGLQRGYALGEDGDFKAYAKAIKSREGAVSALKGSPTQEKSDDIPKA